MKWHPRFASFTLVTCVLALQTAGCSGSDSSAPPTPEPSALISAATLKGWVDSGAVNRAGAGRVVVLDVTPAATYNGGHIPGAQLVNSATELYQNRKEGPAVDVNMVLDGARMDALVQGRGIDADTTIVLTSSNILSATRAYWMFRYWGFPKAKLKVLDGLNGAWDADYALTTTTPSITDSSYSVRSHAGLRDDLRASLSEMMVVAGGGVANAVVLDARTNLLTDGVFAPAGDYTVFEGRIKGAQALPYTSLYDGTTLKFKSPGDLRTIFGGVGIDATKTTYAHCRTGVIASLPFFVLDGILNWPAVNYDASWSQWGQLSTDSANGGQLAAGSPWRTDIAALSDFIEYNHTTRKVELLALDGATCSGTLDPDGATTFSPANCTLVEPDSATTSGNQVEEADVAYMAQ